MPQSSDEIIAAAIRRVLVRARVIERHRPAFDLAVTVTLALLSFVGLLAQDRLRHPDTVAFCVLLVAPLPFMRRHARLAFSAVTLIALVQWFTSTPQIADASVLVLLFALAVDGELNELAAAACVVEAGAILAALRWSPDDPLKVWVGITGLGVAAAAVGLALRERRQLVVSLGERAARLEVERDQEGQLGAMAERARIAREMHDIVSHNLTVMITLADGASYALEADPGSARSAIERLSSTGRQALGEMRRLLGVLHEEGPADPLEPQPGLDRFDQLLERVEAAGIPVAFALTGDPHALSPGVQLTIFRVAQEALTNTLKHAGRPARASVSLHCRPGHVVLEVGDDGPGVTRDAPAIPSAGRGLSGMRERAAAFGGALEAGPDPAGGWRVQLVLPIDVVSVSP